MAVNLGQLAYGTELQGVNSTLSDIEQLETGITNVEESAISSNESLSEFEDGVTEKTESVEEMSEASEEGATSIGILEGAIDLLGLDSLIAGTRVGRLTNKLTNLASVSSVTGVITTISGAISTLGAKIAAIPSLIAGSTTALLSLGAAVGAVLGGGIVKALEITGILDKIGDLGKLAGNAFNDSLADVLLTATSPILAPLSAIGGFVDGFVRDIDKGFGEALTRGINQANQALDIFFKSGSDTIDMLLNPLDTLQGYLGGIVNLAQDAVGYFSDLANIDLPDLPKVQIPDAPNFSLPSLNGGGKIESDGIAQVHKDEYVIPENDLKSSGSGSESRVEKNEYKIETNVNVPDAVVKEIFDPDDLTPAQISKLANLLGSETGDSIKKEIE